MLLFIVILIGIKWLLVEIADPLNSSPDALAQKIRMLNSQKMPVNTLFIGSSRTYTGLIPDYFDSLTGQTHSMNLGVSRLYMPHTADLCRQMLARPELPLRYILFELSLPNGSFDPFQGEPMADADFFRHYWLAPISNLTAETGRTLTSNLNEYIYNLLSPLNQLFILRMKLPVLTAKLARLKARYLAAPDKPEPILQKPVIDQQRLAQTETNFEVSYTGYITSHRQMNRPSSALLAMHQRGLRVYQTDTLPGNPAYSFYRKQLLALQRIAARQGVRIFFYLPSRMTREESTLLLPIFRQLAPAQRLEILHDARFDQLFDPRFSMDDAHLNHTGARLYTTLIAEAFRQQVYQVP